MVLVAAAAAMMVGPKCSTGKGTGRLVAHSQAHIRDCVAALRTSTLGRLAAAAAAAAGWRSGPGSMFGCSLCRAALCHCLANGAERTTTTTTITTTAPDQNLCLFLCVCPIRRRLWRRQSNNGRRRRCFGTANVRGKANVAQRDWAIS